MPRQEELIAMWTVARSTDLVSQTWGISPHLIGLTMDGYEMKSAAVTFDGEVHLHARP
jgi:hypothetical protein